MISRGKHFFLCHLIFIIYVSAESSHEQCFTLQIALKDLKGTKTAALTAEILVWELGKACLFALCPLWFHCASSCQFFLPPKSG